MRLKILREESKLSQLDLANKLNMSQQAVSAYEKETREPDIETINKLADFFGVSIDYLLGKSDIRSPQKIKLDEMEIAFASGIKGLNKENQETLKNIMDGLLAKQKIEDEKKEEK